MTFCPVPAFKKRGTFYSESDFNENTFTIDEMFDEKTVKTLKNESLFELNEVRTSEHCIWKMFHSSCQAPISRCCVLFGS